MGWCGCRGCLAVVPGLNSQLCLHPATSHPQFQLPGHEDLGRQQLRLQYCVFCRSCDGWELGWTSQLPSSKDAQLASNSRCQRWHPTVGSWDSSSSGDGGNWLAPTSPGVLSCSVSGSGGRQYSFRTPSCPSLTLLRSSTCLLTATQLCQQQLLLLRVGRGG